MFPTTNYIKLSVFYFNFERKVDHEFLDENTQSNYLTFKKQIIKQTCENFIRIDNHNKPFGYLHAMVVLSGV